MCRSGSISWAKYAVFIFIYQMTVHIANAQVTPFDFLEASRKANEVDQKLRNFNGPNLSASCQTLKSKDGQAVASCSIQSEDFNVPIVKVDYSENQLPDPIKEVLPLDFIKDTKNKKISCIYRFQLRNDNQQMFGRSGQRNTSENMFYGDDLGRTHGMDVGVSCASADGVSNAFVYSTDLYTKVVPGSSRPLPDGNYSRKINFTSENIFALLQDNINQNKVTYWKRGVGFINLTEQKKWGLLQSAGQQEWFHRVQNQISPGSSDQYTYEDGSKDQWGGFVSLAVGLQTNRKLGDRCQLKLNADAGGRLSTLKDSSTLNLNLESKLTYQVTDNASIYLRAQSEVTRRSSSTVIENSLAAGVESKTGARLELGVTKQTGNRNDVSDLKNKLTGKNDLQVFVRVGYKY
jgi:hypothetical protein